MTIKQFNTSFNLAYREAGYRPTKALVSCNLISSLIQDASLIYNFLPVEEVSTYKMLPIYDKTYLIHMERFNLEILGIKIIRVIEDDYCEFI